MELNGTIIGETAECYHIEFALDTYYEGIKRETRWIPKASVVAHTATTVSIADDDDVFNRDARLHLAAVVAATPFDAALNAFLDSDDFAWAVEESSVSSMPDNDMTVELFDDATYRVVRTGKIGNRYQSAGMLLRIPAVFDVELEFGTGMDAIKRALKEELWEKTEEKA